MNTKGTRGHPALSLLLSSGTSFLLGTCGTVATAAYLGVDWLREPVLGLPAGVWTIALVQAAGSVMGRPARRSGAARGRRQVASPETKLSMFAGLAAAAAWEGL